MELYLVIITTVLVVSQIVRVAQNHIQLRRQNILFENELGQLNGITNNDLEMQRETYRLLHDWLQKKTMKG